MDPKLKALLEQRANVWSQMTEVIDAAEKEGRDLSAEEAQKYDNGQRELDKLTSKIERAEKHADTERRMREVRTDPNLADTTTPADDETRSEDEVSAEYRDAFEAYVTRGMAELEPEQRKALREGWKGGEKRAQAVGTNTAGGYLVPAGFRQKIVEKMKAFGSVQSVAQVIETNTGATLPWPTNDDTGNVGALLAENTAATEQDILLGMEDLGAYKYTSKIVRVSLEFIQDVDWMDAEEFLRRKFAERLARIHNQHWTTGTGVSQPQGIVTGAVSGATAAGIADITFDELIDLEHSVDPAYRDGPNVAFMLSDAALKIVRKKKDGNGAYIWQPSTQAGVPSLLNGRRYVINNDMAAPATGVKSVLFGDFEAGYIIRLVKAFELIRLNERYAEFGQVGFIAFDRADGVVQDNSAYKALTQA